MTIPKYAIVEHERRFLVDPAALPPLAEGEGTLIEDLYVEGSRLRLRRMTGPGGETVYKLCKKYPHDPADAGPIVNIYLDAAEFRLLADLPGRWLRKRRRPMVGGAPFVLDVFEEPLSGLVIAEVETGDAGSLAGITPPGWAVREITADQFYTGGNLSWLAPGVLAARLRRDLAGAVNESEEPRPE